MPANLDLRVPMVPWGQSGGICRPEGRQEEVQKSVAAKEVSSRTLERPTPWAGPCPWCVCLRARKGGREQGGLYHRSRPHGWRPSAGTSLPGGRAAPAGGSRSAATPRSPSRPAPLQGPMPGGGLQNCCSRVQSRRHPGGVLHFSHIEFTSAAAFQTSEP